MSMSMSVYMSVYGMCGMHVYVYVYYLLMYVCGTNPVFFLVPGFVFSVHCFLALLQQFACPPSAKRFLKNFALPVPMLNRFMLGPLFQLFSLKLAHVGALGRYVGSSCRS